MGIGLDSRRGAGQAAHGNATAILDQFATAGVKGRNRLSALTPAGQVSAIMREWLGSLGVRTEYLGSDPDGEQIKVSRTSAGDTGGG
jgi:hypothetical protein